LHSYAVVAAVSSTDLAKPITRGSSSLGFTDAWSPSYAAMALQLFANDTRCQHDLV
jgi:hypothetical protein